MTLSFNSRFVSRGNKKDKMKKKKEKGKFQKRCLDRDESGV
jgi:hypothetical protein